MASSFIGIIVRRAHDPWSVTSCATDLVDIYFPQFLFVLSPLFLLRCTVYDLLFAV